MNYMRFAFVASAAILVGIVMGIGIVSITPKHQAVANDFSIWVSEIR